MIMSNCGNWNWITIGAIVLIWAGPALAVTDAQKCEAAKLKVAGKYNFCRLKAEAKAVKTGNPVDYRSATASSGEVGGWRRASAP